MTVADVPLLPESFEELDRYYGEPPIGVRANMITALDGGAAFDGRTKAITDPADQLLLAYLRSCCDVVIAGSATIAAEQYGPVRLRDALRRRRTRAGLAELPRLAIVTARGALSPELRIFSDPAQRPLIVTTGRTASDRPQLGELGDVIVAGDDVIEPAAALKAFGALGLGRVLCEGGPYLLSTLIDADLVDDMCLTIAPYLAGSQPTTPQPTSSLLTPTRLRLRHVLQRNELLYLRYSRTE
ncbi:MAG TPA: pyrimidine reductase family protein [Mycobacteriales bacterium]|nr:pyrimidine reductase family protein [Mycobacteriales bacterium]HVX70945.1 pyrimidine reductase family protein [Mycobacteriales bacterium]